MNHLCVLLFIPELSVCFTASFNLFGWPVVGFFHHLLQSFLLSLVRFFIGLFVVFSMNFFSFFLPKTFLPKKKHTQSKTFCINTHTHTHTAFCTLFTPVSICHVLAVCVCVPSLSPLVFMFEQF